jgi:hypothetical protein
VYLFCARRSNRGRQRRVLTGEAGSGSARGSELWCNSGSHPSPPATKGQVEGEGAAGAAIEGKWLEGKALTGDSGGALLQMKN